MWIDHAIDPYDNNMLVYEKLPAIDLKLMKNLLKEVKIRTRARYFQKDILWEMIGFKLRYFKIFSIRERVATAWEQLWVPKPGVLTSQTPQKLWVDRLWNILRAENSSSPLRDRSRMQFQCLQQKEETLRCFKARRLWVGCPSSCYMTRGEYVIVTFASFFRVWLPQRIATSPNHLEQIHDIHKSELEGNYFLIFVPLVKD